MTGLEMDLRQSIECIKLLSWRQSISQAAALQLERPRIAALQVLQDRGYA